MIWCMEAISQFIDDFKEYDASGEVTRDIHTWVLFLVCGDSSDSVSRRQKFL